jgi:glutathione S-transferase
VVVLVSCLTCGAQNEGDFVFPFSCVSDFSRARTPQLSYFNGRGRGEQVRLLLVDLKLPYQDVRLEGAGFPEFKATGKADFGFLPVLEDGDFTISQGAVILGYLARKHKLVDPNNLKLAAKLDSIASAAEDIRLAYFKISRGTAEEKAEFVHKTLVDRWFPNLEKLLQGGNFFQNQPHATHADYAIFDVLNALAQPAAAPASATELKKFPGLDKFYTHFSERPAIAEWLAKRPNSPF